ncbi:MAG: hypothetical protein WEA36_02970 [Balneolaceae bacterium]
MEKKKTIIGLFILGLIFACFAFYFGMQVEYKASLYDYRDVALTSGAGGAATGFCILSGMCFFSGA